MKACNLFTLRAGGVRLEIVKYLVEKGASLQAKNDEGLQPIHSASLGGRLEIVKYLVEKGVSVQAKNDEGLQPLHYAIAEATSGWRGSRMSILGVKNIMRVKNIV